MADIDRDYILRGDEVVAYGLADHVLAEAPSPTEAGDGDGQPLSEHVVGADGDLGILAGSSHRMMATRRSRSIATQPDVGFSFRTCRKMASPAPARPATGCSRSRRRSRRTASSSTAPRPTTSGRPAARPATCCSSGDDGIAHPVVLVVDRPVGQAAARIGAVAERLRQRERPGRRGAVALLVLGRHAAAPDPRRGRSDGGTHRPSTRSKAWSWAKVSDGWAASTTISCSAPTFVAEVSGDGELGVAHVAGVGGRATAPSELDARTPRSMTAVSAIRTDHAGTPGQRLRGGVVEAGVGRRGRRAAARRSARCGAWPRWISATPRSPTSGL